MAYSDAPQPLTFRAAAPLTGTVTVPGDKSISHWALMLSALAVGTSHITGLLEGKDALATATAMRTMGADISRAADGIWNVDGVGIGGLMQPATVLDMGNSGTSMRLLIGLLASHNLTATFIGDASLSKRPMGRVIDPLSAMGAEFTSSPGGAPPITVRGLSPAVPMDYRLPVASAQVKSAILLAALNTPGITRVIEPITTRDHSERMRCGFGADLEVRIAADGTRNISVRGEAELKPQDILVPGDPSSAAFPIVAALIVPGSEVTVTNVGINHTRAELFIVLESMGANLVYSNQREVGGEKVADITARYGSLKGVDVPEDIVPSMIDEFPILFVAAALAEGQTRTTGLGELRVKESDRLALMTSGLARIGVRAEQIEDGLLIDGSGGAPFASGNRTPVIEAALDHRIAMSFAVAGLAMPDGLQIDDMRPVATSFPGFLGMLRHLGAEI